jgi:2-dehydro-3-deoxyglucarate aldolase
VGAVTVQEIRQLLSSGGVTVGGWMQLTDSSVAELMGAAGYDWVAVDLEHGRYSEPQLVDIFRAIQLGGTVPMARVGEVSAYAIKAALESGAQGVILPMIESAAQLRQAIAWAHYPPRGQRGVGYSRANLWGQNFDGYRNNFDPLIVAQIEHIDAVRAIPEILQLPGLDALMVGPYDLSASMGLTGQFDHPDFKAALATVLSACSERGMPAGQHVVKPGVAQLDAAIASGYRFIAYCTDAIFLWSAAARPRLP